MCPAFLAARNTWLMNVLSFGARVLRIRPRPDTQVAIANGHIRPSNGAKAPTVPKMSLIALPKTQSAARVPTDRHARTQAMPMACGSTGEPLYLAIARRIPTDLQVSADFFEQHMTIRKIA